MPAAADAALAVWRSLWRSDADGEAGLMPDGLFVPYDSYEILSGAAARAHCARRRARGGLLSASFEALSCWQEGAYRIVLGELDFTLSVDGTAERHTVRAGFWLDRGERAVVIAEAAPAAMILLNQAYMDEAAR